MALFFYLVILSLIGGVIDLTFFESVIDYFNTLFEVISNFFISLGQSFVLLTDVFSSTTLYFGLFPQILTISAVFVSSIILLRFVIGR